MRGVRRTVPILRNLFRLLPLAAPHKATIGHLSGGSKGAVTTACIFILNGSRSTTSFAGKGERNDFD
jgi:hypothetical protein